MGVMRFYDMISEMEKAEREVRSRVMVALAQLSAMYPQQRIAQIMFNALDTKGLARWPSGDPRDIFYIPDRVLMEALEHYRTIVPGESK